MMDKSTFTPHGLDMDVLNAATRGTGVVAGRRTKAEGKCGMNEQALSWESAFHAERGCLDGGLPLHFTAPLPHH
jgi:hypothetical protein